MDKDKEEKLNRKLPQEQTSTYFNSIIKANCKPLTVDDLDKEVMSRFERLSLRRFLQNVRS